MSEKVTFLYFLRESDSEAFKIGVSVDARNRARTLPEDIDWTMSHRVAFTSGVHARRAERFLHTFLKEFNVPKGHKEDGYTEWFSEKGARLALKFIKSNQTFLKCSFPEPIPKSEVIQSFVDADTTATLKVARNSRRLARLELSALNNTNTMRVVIDSIGTARKSGILLGICGPYLIFDGMIPKDFPKQASLSVPGGAIPLFGTCLNTPAYSTLYSAIHDQWAEVLRLTRAPEVFTKFGEALRMIDSISFEELPDEIQRSARISQKIRNNERTPGESPDKIFGAYRLDEQSLRFLAFHPCESELRGTSTHLP